MRKLQHNLEDLMEQLKKKFLEAPPTQAIITIDLGADTKLKKTERPQLYFTSKALSKMSALVKACDIEVAWHMTIENTAPLYYKVLDILVYPQLGCATYVEGDDDLYPEWMINLTDEEHAAIRGQGHSHVNMSVGPSSTDIANMCRFIKHVRDYYLFVIVNKRGEMNITLYDMQAQVVYTDADIDIVFATDLWAKEQLNKYLKRMKGVAKHGSEQEPGVFQSDADYRLNSYSGPGGDRLYTSY